VVHACALRVDLQISASTSLKDKRMVLRHLLDTARRRYGVAAAEVGYHDRWQRAELGFAAVGATVGHVDDILDTVERFIWSHPEIDVVGSERHWMDAED
jgi:uncharacterized protein YlxP (DUF503 family)